MRITDHYAPHYVVFSILPLLCLSQAQILSSIPYSQTPSAYVPPSMRATKFHTHTNNTHKSTCTNNIKYFYFMFYFFHPTVVIWYQLVRRCVSLENVLKYVRIQLYLHVNCQNIIFYRKLAQFAHATFTKSVVATPGIQFDIRH